jgi:hypothetical protein
MRYPSARSSRAALEWTDVVPLRPAPVERRPPAPRITARDLVRALALGVPVLYALVIAVSWTRTGADDYRQFLAFHELQYWGSSLFGTAKQWTPLIAGGVSMAGHPQIPVFSLSMALAYLFGPLAGLKIALVAYLVVGWIGMYSYAGLWLSQRVQRSLAASLFIGNGYFLARFSHGHVDMIPFLVLPLVLWLSHRVAAWDRHGLGARGVACLLLAMVLLGAGLGLVVDGAPVAFVHLLVWIGLYVLVLSFVTRSPAPLALLGGALVISAILDAGYLWPMLVAQQQFPRLTQDAFTDPVTLLWFMLLPVRGKLIPAPANGHELSVFIGPVVAFAIWRWRKPLLRSISPEMRAPLAVVSAASIWLGMGSLRPLHVPELLSPFDLLRLLPGFRSIEVTGRYWGFLAAPLSLLGAAALSRFASDERPAGRRRFWLAVALLLQLGLQTESLAGGLLASDRYRPVPFRKAFRHGAERIEYVRCPDDEQAARITPRTGIINFYDMDDFARPAMREGDHLVRGVLQKGVPLGNALPCDGKFVAWSRIRIEAGGQARAAVPGNPRAIVQIVLNQAYHPFWEVVGAGACLRPDVKGNLTVLCSRERLGMGPVDLVFHDPVSEGGMRVSLAALRLWPATVLALVLLVLGLRKQGSPPSGGEGGRGVGSCPR